MFRYTAECEIQSPLAEVFAYLSDVTRQTEWVHGVSECRWESPGSVAVGAIAVQSMTFMGKARVVPITVVDYQPGRRIVFEKRQPFLIRFGFEVEEVNGATRVRYPVEMEPRGLFRLVIPLMGRKVIRGDLERISARLSSPDSFRPKATRSPS
jgi:carbon monoxide dehydrogenase subunit G